MDGSDVNGMKIEDMEPPKEYRNTPLVLRDRVAGFCKSMREQRRWERSTFSTLVATLSSHVPSRLIRCVFCVWALRLLSGPAATLCFRSTGPRTSSSFPPCSSLLVRENFEYSEVKLAIPFLLLGFLKGERDAVELRWMAVVVGVSDKCDGSWSLQVGTISFPFATSTT